MQKDNPWRVKHSVFNPFVRIETNGAEALVEVYGLLPRDQKWSAYAWGCDSQQALESILGPSGEC